MDAITYIKEHLDIYKIMEHYEFDGLRLEGNMIRSACKIHGGNNKTAFVANPESGLWYCHTGNCGAGDVFTLVQIMEECSFNESVHFVANFFGIDIENMDIKERKTKHIEEMKQWVDMMRNRKRQQNMKAYSMDVPVREVTKFRDFEEKTLQHFKLGFVDTIQCDKRSGGHYTLNNRLVIPIEQHGKQIGISLRATRKGDYPKWSHQPLNIKTRDLLYNYDSCVGQERIAVVEGAFDVWAFYEVGIPAVATYGAHLTDEQYKLLIKTGADLVFAYDGDEAGFEARDKAIQILKYKANIEYVVFDEGEDPASISRNHLKLKYESREKIC